MLCKNCERIIPNNQTICSYCGTSAVDILSENTDTKKNNNQYSNRKRNRKKNKKNNITHINNAVISEEKKTPTESPDKMPQEFKPESDIPQSVPEIPPAPSENPLEKKPEPEIPSPPAETKNIMSDTISEIEKVSKNSDLPKPDNKHTLPNASGIIYEIAEELYLKEKTASEIEALCQPPFKKVFSEKQIEQLNEQAQEKAIKLVSSTITEQESKTDVEQETVSEQAEDNKQQKGLTTAGAFLLQLVLFIPVVNIVMAIFLSFGRSVNINLKSYSRAFLIWCILVMVTAFLYLLMFYISNPSNIFSNINLNYLFHG